MTSKRPRRNRSAGFEAKVALAAMLDEKMLADLAQPFDAHANQITQWRFQLLKGAAEVSGSTPGTATAAAQIREFGISCGSVYHQPRRVSDSSLAGAAAEWV